MLISTCCEVTDGWILNLGDLSEKVMVVVGYKFSISSFRFYAMRCDDKMVIKCFVCVEEDD